MALALIRPTTPLGLRMPEKAEPSPGKKTIQKAGNTLPDGACAYPAYNTTTPLDPRRPDKAEPPSGKKAIKKAGNINVFPAFALNGI